MVYDHKNLLGIKATLSWNIINNKIQKQKKSVTKNTCDNDQTFMGCVINIFLYCLLRLL